VAMAGGEGGGRAKKGGRRGPWGNLRHIWSEHGYQAVGVQGGCWLAESQLSW
jgi:hypothetical protein